MSKHSAKIKNRRAFTVSLSSLGIIIAGAPLHAANKAWSTSSPGPADGNFSGTNWTTATTGSSTPTGAAATGDALFFDTSSITTLNNDLSGATFAGITFNSGASAYAIGGNAFTLSGNLANNSASLQTFSNNITLAAAQTITGAGNISLSGNLDGSGTSLTKSGTGTLSLSGTTNSIGGNLFLGAGRLNVTAGATNFAGAFSNLGNTASTTAVIGVSSGATFGLTGTSGGNFASASGASMALYNAGTFNQSSTSANNAGIYLGNAANSYGYLRNASSANTTIAGRLWVAQSGNAQGSVGMLDVQGGTVTVNGTNQSAPLQINSDGNSHATSTSYAGINLVNGTLTIAKNSAQTNIGANAGTANTYTSWNITGTGKFTAGNSGTDSGIGLGVISNATNIATLTIANGGTLETSYIYNTNALGTGVINIDNGTIRSLFNNSTGIIQGTNTKTYIYSGGATFDTNGFATIVQNALLAPTGNGIDSITLGGTVTGYVGAPVVKISGGGGTGAAAIANFDPATGMVTGITITSPGSGYTSAPTVTLVGGNGGSIGAGAGTATANATIAAVTGGGLTKIGNGTLTLTGANTYTGATAVNGGTLALSGNGTLGTGSFSIGGGTLDLGGKSITNTFAALTSGAANNGTITNNAGAYAVQSGVIGAKLAGSNSLIKSGNGTVTLNGANTYSGGTTIAAGTLTLGATGSIAGSINLGTAGSQGTLDLTSKGSNFSLPGSLSGYGSINIGAGKTVNLVSGAFAPGNSPGIVSVTGNLALGDITTTMEVFSRNGGSPVAGMHFDQVIVSGTVSFGGDLTVDTTGLSGLANGDSFTLFSASSYAGDFSTMSIGGAYIASMTYNAGTDSWSGVDSLSGVSFTFNEGTGVLAVAVTAVPEPSSFAALAGLAGLGFAASRRRKTAA